MSEINISGVAASPSGNTLSGLFRGRIGRLHYLIWNLFFAFFFMICFFVLFMVGAQYTDDNKMPVELALMVLLLLLFWIPITVVGIGLSIRRLHDIGWTGWLVLLFLVPYVDAAFSIVLFVVPGAKTANDYGAVPAPDRRWTDSLMN